MSRLDCGPGRVPPPANSGNWRRWSLLAVVVISCFAGYGLSRIRIDDDLRSLLRSVRPASLLGGDDAAQVDEEFAIIDAIGNRFGAPDRDCIVRVKCQQDTIFHEPGLSQLRGLVKNLQALPDVDRVRSMFEVRREGVAGAILPVIPKTSGELDAETLREARSRAQAHPLVNGQLLSADGTTALFIVRLSAGADQPPRLGQAVEAIESTLTAFHADEITAQLTGLPALRHQAAIALRNDMLIFNSLGLTLALILSAVLARSLRSTVVACLPPAVGAVWAMGILGLFGAPINLLTSVVPSLALVVGTCDSIHFIEDMRRSVRRGTHQIIASSNAIKRVGTACGLTSIVTAVGFASLAAARIEAVRTFGIAAAAGALASFAAVTLLTPLLASTQFCQGLRLGRSWRLASRIAGTLTSFSIHHARPIAAVGLVGTLFLTAIGMQVDADNRVVDSLPRQAASSQALIAVDEEFGGVMGVDVVVHWPEGVSWRSDELLDTLNEVHTILNASDATSRPLSLASVTNSMPPRARRRLSADAFDEMIDPDARMAIVRARVRDAGSRQLETVYGNIDKKLSALAVTHDGWRFKLAGMSVISAKNIRQLITDLGGSLLLEVAVIAIILAIAFRSPVAGIVSLIPNVFPLAVIAAVLVLTGRSLDPATVIVFNVCLGLAVDDTVHIMAALARNRREGVSVASAMRRAIVETGNPVVLGGLILSVGFAAVTVSSVPSLAGFGRLACAAVAAATVAELILLPAVLVVTDDLLRRSARLGRAWKHDPIFGPAPTSAPVSGMTAPSASAV
ncbi:MMPL family transporter [Pirellulales bacterium]|nr:MMPL family transporter [Pirellulales bacterium]